MSIQVCPTDIPQVLVIEPKIFFDERGSFYESFNQKNFCDAIEIEANFVQDNQSRSSANVLRGLHYQVKQPQGKLVRVLSGSIFDVAVDIRQGSPSFGQHVAIELSAVNNRQLWIPEGFAHGFLTTSETAVVLYKTTDYYDPDCERCILWDDPTIDVDWPTVTGSPILSFKDREGVLLSDAELLF